MGQITVVENDGDVDIVQVFFDFDADDFQVTKNLLERSGELIGFFFQINLNTVSVLIDIENRFAQPFLVFTLTGRNIALVYIKMQSKS